MPDGPIVSTADSNRAPARSIGLGVKFALLIGVALACTLGVRAVHMAREQRDVFYQHLVESSEGLGRFVATISPEAILGFDFETLDAHVREISRNHEVLYAAVFDSNGNNLTSYLDYDRPLIKAVALRETAPDLPRVIDALNAQDGVVAVAFPVNHGDEVIGSVRLGLDTGQISALAHQIMLRHLLVDGATILVLSLCIYVVFRMQALRPIRALTEASSRVSGGTLDVPVRVYAADELGQLARTFNQMMTRLRVTLDEKDDALRQLKEFNRTLEQRVARRTVELERSETRLRAIIESIGEGIITVDEKGYVMSMNPAAERVFGASSAELQGMHSALLLADQHTAELARLPNYADSTDNPFRVTGRLEPVEYAGQRMNGEPFPMEVVVTPMRLGHEQLRVCIVRDITHRRETEQRLAEAQQQLVDAAHKSGMAEMATGVLHNIGNLLNTAMLSVEQMDRSLKQSRLEGLNKATELLRQHVDDLPGFVAADERGKTLPHYLVRVKDALNDDHAALAAEVASLREKTAMMRDVIATQQSYARFGLQLQALDVVGVVEDALRVQQSALKRWDVAVERDYGPVPRVTAHKSKLLQVFTNLIKNGIDAMAQADVADRPRRLRVAVDRAEDGQARVRFSDAGCGIAPDNLTLIFTHGFTTKSDGHGFGLHDSALAMREMRGSLHAHSPGPGQGATFTVLLAPAREHDANTAERPWAGVAVG
jgi:PAS domain S-box-containing protein